MTPRWTPASILRRARDVYEAEGLRSVALRIVGELGYRRMLLLERVFDFSMTFVEPGLPVVFRPVVEDDAAALAGLVPHVDEAEVRRRLRAGREAWVAVDGDRIVQCAWFADGRVDLEYLGIDLELPPDVIFVYDLYTRPEVRGRNLHRAMWPHCLRHFGNRGYERVWAAFHPENRTWKLFLRLDFFPIRVVGRVKVGRWKRVFSRPPRPSDVAARRRARRSRSRRGGRPSSPGASTRRSPGRAS